MRQCKLINITGNQYLFPSFFYVSRVRNIGPIPCVAFFLDNKFPSQNAPSIIKPQKPSTLNRWRSTDARNERLTKLHHVFADPIALNLSTKRLSASHGGLQRTSVFSSKISIFLSSLPGEISLAFQTSPFHTVAFGNDVPGLRALLGFSNASIMSWCRSIFFLWSALLAVWKTLSSPISFRSFSVSSFTIWIVGASADLSFFCTASAEFECRFEPAFPTGEFISLDVLSLASSRLRDGRHPIMPSLKHSRI